MLIMSGDKNVVQQPLTRKHIQFSTDKSNDSKIEIKCTACKKRFVWMSLCAIILVHMERFRRNC